jgi:predicted dehydrogenase
MDIALVGTGVRSRTVYFPIFASLRARGVRLVAVCDPVREHADAFAESLGARAFYSIRDLVRARPMEAALVASPIETHHSISCYLSQNGIHNLVETPIASTLAQAQDMMRTARDGGVVFRVGEQFFRLPAQRIAQRVDKTGFLGPINRVVSTFDYTGFHNNSCWIVFFGDHPTWVQAIEHTMAVAPHYSMPHRFHQEETFLARFYAFPKGRMAIDLTSNPKGLLGRFPRPGYTQFEGQRGTITWRAAGRWNGPLHYGEGEVRYCSDKALETNGIVDTVFPMVHAQENEFTRSLHVELPSGCVEYANPFYRPLEEPVDALDYYHASVAEHVIEFARVVRGEARSEYSDEDAVMAMMMEVACSESTLRDGARVALPLTGDLESEEQVLESLAEKLGRDPLDVEGMLDMSVARS